MTNHFATQPTQYKLGKKCGEELIGTALDIEACLPEGANRNDRDFCAGIDEVAYCCPNCGWWVEAGDVAEDPLGEDLCTDCADDQGSTRGD